jgi:hypothetical protein
MPKIIEPLAIAVERLDGVFFASCSYRVGLGAPRVKLGSGITTTDALSALLAAFRRAGHAGKRFETMGFQPPLRGSVPGWRKREPRVIQGDIPMEALADGNW